MSSSQNPSPQPPKSAPSTAHPAAQADSSPETVLSAETDMDQPSVSTLSMDSSTASTSSEGMSSPAHNSADSSATPEASDALTAAHPLRQHPIPPASEPMQYRAIGLVQGTYTPSEGQFTRGNLITQEGTAIDAVLLGRVMSLVKKHLDLAQPHLWVVYPRTRDKHNDLHVQIVGVWEPENLSKADEAESSDADTAATEASSTVLNDGYFSIRGEILFHSEEEERLIIRIQQSPKKPTEEAKSFKLILKGKLTGKTVGYFWELNVQREGNELVLRDGKAIGLVPPRKRSEKEKQEGPRGGGRGPAKKPWKGPSKGGKPQRPSRPGEGTSGYAPPTPRESVGKPIKRPKES